MVAKQRERHQPATKRQVEPGASVTRRKVRVHGCSMCVEQLRVQKRAMLLKERMTRHTPTGTGIRCLPRPERLGSRPQRCARSGLAGYLSDGSMISANALRARFRRDFTVPRLQWVISAISSYERPSISRNTNTSR